MRTERAPDAVYARYAVDLGKRGCREQLLQQVLKIMIAHHAEQCGKQGMAVLHQAFICDLYEIEVVRGRYFPQTHSHSADGWDQPAASQVDRQQWWTA